MAQGLEITLKLRNVGTNRALGMTRSCLAPIQITLKARVAPDVIKYLFVVCHCAGVSPRASSTRKGAKSLLTRSCRPIEQRRWAKKGRVAHWRLLPAGATLQVLRGAEVRGVPHRQPRCRDGAQEQAFRQQRRFPWPLLAPSPPAGWRPPLRLPATEPLQPSIPLLS